MFGSYFFLQFVSRIFEGVKTKLIQLSKKKNRYYIRKYDREQLQGWSVTQFLAKIQTNVFVSRI